jgi:prophage DNA circulation protein
MIKADLNEAMAATGTVLDALLLTLHGSGLAGAKLTFLCGQLRDNGWSQLNAGGTSFWASFAACFEAAVPAGATFEAMDAVRAAANRLTTASRPGIAVKNFSVRMALAEQARILAATTFVSREDIDNYFNSINASFDAAKKVAADNLDNTAYVALLAIHAAVSNDLANRSRPLPRMVTYSFPRRMPSLWLAQRIYYDPSRNDEVIAENKPIHPLFMPPTGKALSA